jgi:hypothetical protein
MSIQAHPESGAVGLSLRLSVLAKCSTLTPVKMCLPLSWLPPNSSQSTFVARRAFVVGAELKARESVRMNECAHDF